MQPEPTPPAAEPAEPTSELSLEGQASMVCRLRQRLAAQQWQPVQKFETHISIVLVCGERAYKIKKALQTPFLDQSTLALRQHACQEELRLNRRLAPDLYLAVVPITGTADAPELAGAGPALDAAVQMRAFAQGGLWDLMAGRGELGAAHIDELVQSLGPFHAAAAVAEPGGRLGTPEQVRAPLRQSLDEIESLVEPGAARTALDELRRWEADAFARLAPVMAQRLQQGRVRECHGDLHLGNVTVIDGRSTVFDGIEFNDDFRWIDVMSEVAFMAMDLHAHGLPRLAHRFVNGYLELCGDYGGVQVLDYYLVHRALVRSKVHGLRAAQCAAGRPGAAAEAQAAAGRYLNLALGFSRREGAVAVLMFTHGLSGSGKSTLTQGLLEQAGAIRIRADVERKRLAGLQPLARPAAPQARALYGAEMTEATYAQLANLATPVLRSGRHVILDATFLRRGQRDAARQLAAREGVRCVRLDFDAAPELLRQRLRDRADRGRDASDADEAVLAAQMRTAEAVQDGEDVQAFRCRRVEAAAADAAKGVAVEADWSALLQWLGAGANAGAGVGAGAGDGARDGNGGGAGAGTGAGAVGPPDRGAGPRVQQRSTAAPL